MPKLEANTNAAIYIATITDDNALEVAKLVKAVLREKHIISSIEGGTAGLNVSVDARQVEAAVKAIAVAQELRAKGLVFNDDMLAFLNGVQRRPSAGDRYIIVATYKGGADQAASKRLHLELLKRGVEAVLISCDTGVCISISERNLNRALKAMTQPPDLRDQGVVISENLLQLLK
jgi:hypothetical protein